MSVVYEDFDIVSVAKQCGIRFHYLQRNDVEFKALCPFCGDRKYHLGLNRKKGQFHCFRCKESGNSVSLFAKLNGLTNSEAYSVLKDRCTEFQMEKIVYRNEETTPMRSLTDRHNVYRE